MLIELLPNTTHEQIEDLMNKLYAMGFMVIRQDSLRLAIAHGIDSLVIEEDFKFLPHIAKIIPFTQKYKLSSRQSKPENTIIEINDVKIGGNNLFIVAGPCSIESEEQLEACAKVAASNGARGLRGGAYKPRTSPYEFQGMGIDGVILISNIAKKYGLLSISEIMDVEQLHQASKYLDIIQIGARNMQNSSLLKELGKVSNPILLKRGFAATYQELLLAAEYVMSAGNQRVILCERGIRTFENYTRNTLDLNAVPALKELTHLPIMVDPSHGTGLRNLVPVMARAGIAAGACGVLVEMHPDPDKSVSDAMQALSFETFSKMSKQLIEVHSLVKNY
jgi:3-deoxy-7-phosphoheptulonate synthase